MDPNARERTPDIDLALYLSRTRQESVSLPRHFLAYGGIKCNGFPPSGTAHSARAQIESENAGMVALFEGLTGAPPVSLSAGIATPLRRPFAC
jgi:hypothetical protein